MNKIDENFRLFPYNNRFPYVSLLSMTNDSSYSQRNQARSCQIRRIFSDLWFVVFTLAAVALLALLLSYHNGDAGWSTSGSNEEIKNWFGATAAYVSDAVLSILGYSAYGFAIGLAALGWQNLKAEYIGVEVIVWKFFALMIATLALSGIFSLHWQSSINSLSVTGGGLVGQKFSIELLQFWDVSALMWTYTALFFLGLTILLGINWFQITQKIGDFIIGCFATISRLFKGEGLKQEVVDSLQSSEESISLNSVKEVVESSRLDPNTKTHLDWQSYKQDKSASNNQSKQKYAASEKSIFSTTPVSGQETDFFDTLATIATSAPEHELKDDYSKDSALSLSQKESLNTYQNNEPIIDFSFFDRQFEQENEAFSNAQLENEKPEQTVHYSSFSDKAVELNTKENSDNIPPYKDSAQHSSANNLKVNSSVFNQSQQRNHISQTENTGEYQLPPLDLLQPAPIMQADYTDEELDEMAAQTEHALRNYKLDVSVVNIEVGPVVTRLELELAPGIKVSQISNLDKDLARSLAVQSVRVVEVIPGKPYIGLEIPNRKREIVYLRNILESSIYQAQHSPLTLVMGVDIAGKPIVSNLGKMPHLLVAGTTGSGKSVGINVMLASMLYKSTPDELKFILIDPKMLEMSMYENIPHLLTPVVTDMNDAENALRWAVAEMERRYQLMSALKVRNIDAFNAVLRDKKAKGEYVFDPLWQAEEHIGLANQPPEIKPLPYIVIVIDELADMMMAVGKKVEDLITRIAQKARASGIHLILATQRPSVDVITGVIKANAPARIAFQVSSKIDSRTIIERQGAESLLGNGDMLYSASGGTAITRIHGAFISDNEVDNLTLFLRKQGEPQYEEAITNPVSPESMGAFGALEKLDNAENDLLYDKAVALVCEHNKASISWLQRQLNIGYNRSARIVEAMQAAGILSAPERGTRKVLLNNNNDEHNFY